MIMTMLNVMSDPTLPKCDLPVTSGGQRPSITMNRVGHHQLEYIPQRRISVFDHLRPQRWNWYLVHRPLERSARSPGATAAADDPADAQPALLLAGRHLCRYQRGLLSGLHSALRPGLRRQQRAGRLDHGDWQPGRRGALFPGARLHGENGQAQVAGAVERRRRRTHALLLLAFIPLLGLPAHRRDSVAIASLNGAARLHGELRQSSLDRDGGRHRARVYARALFQQAQPDAWALPR
jgi:hypothetical protein